MADISANFDSMYQKITEQQQVGLDFQTKITESNMKFQAEAAALDTAASIAEKISSTAETQARNISN